MVKKRPDKCSKCGNTRSKDFWDLDDGTVLCTKCYKNYKLTKSEQENKQETNYNTIGVVFGVVGLIVLPLLFGILAIVFGAIAKGKGSKKSGAIILGIVDIVWWIIAMNIGFSLL